MKSIQLGTRKSLIKCQNIDLPDRGLMKKKIDAKVTMLEHSKAKIKLLERYLSTYLSILSVNRYTQKINIFDLFCGEGLYENGVFGSPVVIVESVKNNIKPQRNIFVDIWLNDNDQSKIEKGKLKIERVRELCEPRKPVNTTISYTNDDYEIILQEVIHKVDTASHTKSLIFIDPYGYKDIFPSDIKKLLSNKNVELLLFLPITFMYRFAKKSLEVEFSGGIPLRNIITEISDEDNPDFKSHHDFINKMKRYFKNYLNNIYIDTFNLVRDKNNIYCLFFFTHNRLGIHKMIEAKWNIDADQGRGSKLDENTSLLNEIAKQEYRNELCSLIQKTDDLTNHDIYNFGLEKGFLPKHSAEILRDLEKNNLIDKIASDDQPIRKNSFYINSDNERTIVIRWRA